MHETGNSMRGLVPPQPTIHITHDVIAEIAAQSAEMVEGVAERGASLVAGLHEVLVRRPGARGVRVEVTGRDVELALHLVVDYGVRIPELAQKVQEQVKAQVEQSTGLHVARVDIHIQGIALPSAPSGDEG